MLEIVIWQTSISPHMAPLAIALARAGVAVTYIAERAVSPERHTLGWTRMEMPHVQVVVLANQGVDLELLIAKYRPNAVHLVQGLRRNGYLQKVIGLLQARGARWGVLLETVRDMGIGGFLKRLDYRLALSWTCSSADFVLAIGKDMPNWVASRGFPANKVYPFTYFLDSASLSCKWNFASAQLKVIVVGYVGVIEPHKRVDILVSALAQLGDPRLHLSVIGSGSLAQSLKADAILRLGKERVKWREALPYIEVRRAMSRFDCLVLPSDYDGWGAVVSESLISGVPAICSDACGAAEAVVASGVGGVFPRGNVDALSGLLYQMVTNGPPSPERRTSISNWANSFCGDAGAKYLLDIIGSRYSDKPRPPPPWRRVSE